MSILVNISDVCSEIFAGGDAPKSNMSDIKTDEYGIPIFSNGEANDGLYGYTNFARVTQPSITVSARGTIGFVAVRNEPFVPIVRLISLTPNSEKIEIKYLYYALQNYKFDGSGTSIPQLTVPMLKKYSFPLPTKQQQLSIIARLDNICNLIALRKQQLSKLDELVKARFVELFDGKGYPTLKWNEVFNTTTGKLDSNAMVENGEYPFFTCAKEVFRIDKYAFDQEALLLAGNNAAGKYDVKYYKGKFNAYQRTYVLGLKADWSYQLFRYQLEDKLVYLQQQSLGGLTKYLTLKILGELEFVVPPMDKQNAFTAFVEQTDKSKSEIQKSLEKLETLKKALMQKYFG